MLPYARLYVFSDIHNTGTGRSYIFHVDSFLLTFFSGVYKHMDNRVTESKVKNVLFYNKDLRCDRSIMRACVWRACGTFWVARTAWKVIGLGSGKRKKEWNVDKRELFRQVGLVSWTVRSASWLSMPQYPLASMNVRKAHGRRRKSECDLFSQQDGRLYGDEKGMHRERSRVR